MAAKLFRLQKSDLKTKMFNVTIDTDAHAVTGVLKRSNQH